MKVINKIISLTIIMILALTTISYTKAHVSAHSSHTSHTSTHSAKSTSSASKASSSSSKTVSGAKTTNKTYTKSNIKTEKVNNNASYYKNYSSSNFFTPNAWFLLWAFQPHGSGTNGEVTEQDIAKELEERGYSQEEIQEILKEGKALQGIDTYMLANCAKELIRKMNE